MTRIFKSADQLIGNTPLVEFTHIEAAEGLKATVEAYNAACLAGSDEEFGRDASSLIPLAEEGPYYAAEMSLATIYTVGGSKHDVNAQVVDWDENPIPRLFAAGNVADVFNVHTPNLAGAITWGRIAAQSIVGLDAWDEA